MTVDDVRRQRAIRAGCGVDLIEMKPTGHWGLTVEGRDFLDLLDVLHDLDDRPGAAEAANQAGQTPSGGAQSGDDDRPARRARSKRTRS